MTNKWISVKCQIKIDFYCKERYNKLINNKI